MKENYWTIAKVTTLLVYHLIYFYLFQDQHENWINALNRSIFYCVFVLASLFLVHSMYSCVFNKKKIWNKKNFFLQKMNADQYIT